YDAVFSSSTLPPDRRAQSLRGNPTIMAPPPSWRIVPSGDPTPPRVLASGETITAGRSKKATWRILDRRVSSLHARLEGDPNGLRVIDLQSRNGTFVNGNRVSEALLIPGQTLALGGMEFKLEEVGSDLSVLPETPPAPRPEGNAPPVPPESTGALRASDLPRLRSSWLATRTGLLVSREPPSEETALLVSIGREDSAAAERLSITPIDAVDRTDVQFPERGHTPAEADEFISATDPPRPEMNRPAPVSDELPLSRGIDDRFTAFTDARVGTAGTQQARRDGGGAGSPASANGPIRLKQGDDVFSLISGRLANGRPADAEALRSLRPGQIVVLSGIYDHIEAVLGALKVPHVVRSTKEFDSLDLSDVKALLINCPGTLGAGAKGKISKFVEGGGHLFTSDWLLWLIDAAFPGTVTASGQMTGDHWVDVKPEASGHAYLNGVFEQVRGTPKWKIDNGTYPIKVKNLSGVRILISSDQMKKGYGHGAIAVTFGHGKGSVLHCASHFDHLTLNVHGQYAMTQMLVNFLVEAAR
ncbi:MAG: FHA domain-containing protein, partial [Planctomycetes bacterium]|nr:FHA domain-containing protein [Planctomycetota bacterium]